MWYSTFKSPVSFITWKLYGVKTMTRPQPFMIKRETSKKRVVMRSNRNEERNKK